MAVMLFVFLSGAKKCPAQIFFNPFLQPPPLFFAEQAGTWVGEWTAIESKAAVGVSGNMTLDIVRDPLTGAASAFAVLELNAFLGAGIELNGTLSNNIAILAGSVLTPFWVKPLSVDVICTIDSPTHMTGTYTIADYQGGNVKVYEVGIFDLTLLPPLLPILPATAAPVVIDPTLAVPAPLPAPTPAVTPILTPAIATPIIPPTAVAPATPIVTTVALVPVPTAIASPIIAPTAAAPVAPPATPILPTPVVTTVAPTAAISALTPFVPFIPAPPLFIAEQAGTWVGEWLVVDTGVFGSMTLDIVVDPLTGSASGFAVLALNPFLGAGVSLNGSFSNNIVALGGSVQTPFGPKPLTVDIICTIDTPTHMTGTYQIADYQGGSVKIYEVGIFELTLLPPLII